MASKEAIVWSIAGSDCSAYSGIQADIRTAQRFGVHLCTALTAVTAQNSQEVVAIQALDSGWFASQLRSLQSDMPPQAIKIGMLTSAGQIEQLRLLITELKAVNQRLFVVLDPVMVSSSGHRLVDDGTLKAMVECLLPLTDLCTPNIAEAQALLSLATMGSPSTTIDRRRIAGIVRALQDRFKGQPFLLKGGHSTEVLAGDYLVVDDQVTVFESPRLAVTHGRGTGCTLSTAIAALRALDYDLADSVTLAKAYITRALKAGRQLGQGEGPIAQPAWPDSVNDLPRVRELKASVPAPGPGVPAPGIEPQQPAAGFPMSCDFEFTCCDTNALGLYPVVENIHWIKKLLELGVRTLQLRIKTGDMDEREIEAQVEAAVRLGRQYQARLFINDHWRLAIRYQAYGVHLGQEDLYEADLAAIACAGLRLGISTHGYYEIAKAHQLKPSYIALGHLFPTQTKEMPSRPQGLKRLRRYVALLKDSYPTVAIGGINIERAADVVATGVGSIAVVTAITRATDTAQAVGTLTRMIKAASLPAMQPLPAQPSQQAQGAKRGKRVKAESAHG